MIMLFKEFSLTKDRKQEEIQRKLFLDKIRYPSQGRSSDTSGFKVCNLCSRK